MRPSPALATLVLALVPMPAAADDADYRSVDALVAAMLSETPVIDDLRHLVDQIGGRPTGSPANEAAVQWALQAFEDAGVDARAEAFDIPDVWLEADASATVSGGGIGFTPRIAAMPFSPAADGVTAPLVDGGAGAPADFERLGEEAHGAFVLVETSVLEDVPGLFAEFARASGIEDLAVEAGVAGLIYQGSRPGNHLYRQFSTNGPGNEMPLVVMERAGASRALRLMRAGEALLLRLDIELETDLPAVAHNVIGEIRGSERPEEIVVVGAHLDAWDLGTGALDNGCNVAMLIDVARQITRLGLEPRRTIRFILWNGEEHGLWGSLAYVRQHAHELDHHVVAASFDIGSGRLAGFFTGGRPEVNAAVVRALEPVAGLGPFENPDLPLFGSDHFDFLLEGVASLLGHQESANYGPHYHARSDTFEAVDQRQLKLNSAVAAAVTWAFAQEPADWGRLDHDGVRALVEDTDLGMIMDAFGVLEEWERGRRGRRDVGAP